MDDWISVENDLPQEDTRVLVTDGDIITIGKRDFSRRPKLFFVDFGYETTKVTHWQPLPSPPNTTIK